MDDPFEPYVYRPKIAGPRQPTVAAMQEPQGPSLAEIFDQIGTVGTLSKYWRMDEIFDPATRNGIKTFFLLFPGDVALERVMFAWSKSSAGSGLGSTSVDITIEQYSSFDESGTIKRDLFPVGQWLSSQVGLSYILEPIDRVEAFTPVVATIRCLNSTDPVATSWFESEDLELWMTMHFLAGETS